MNANRKFAVALLAAALGACSLAPTYEHAATSTPAAFKQAVPDAAWKAALPAEQAARGEWWKVFGDAQLDALEAEALAANQDLKAAAARLAQSRSLHRAARAERWPQLGVSAGAFRQRSSPAALGLPAGTDSKTDTLWQAEAGIAYELDLFGRVTSTVRAADAEAQRSAALLRSLQLALQADVAQSYFLIRELDAEAALFARTVELRAQSLALLQTRFEVGDISELDLARGRTELATAQAEALGIARRRATAEHALAILLGRAPADFSLAVSPLQRVEVAVPAGLPSALLERRPDIAAAERAMAAANARIGVARAAYFPRLSLTGAFGHESTELGDLFDWSSRRFLLGPQLSLPLLDGGRRRAGLKRAWAVYEEEVASYRQTVLNAFREVEDGLAGLRLLGEQAAAQEQALQSAQRAAQLSQLRYREGSISYLDVIEADRSVLQQQRVAVQLDGARARAAVALIRALGGGWEASPPAPAPAVSLAQRY